jgi:hypothetical protein
VLKPLSKERYSIPTLRTSFGSVVVADRVPTGDQGIWEQGLSTYANDHRYYEVIHKALADQFQHLFLVLKDNDGLTRAIQPFFVVYQDLMTGTPTFVRKPLEKVRLLLPSLLKLKMLMVGCSAGEGDLARDVQTGSIEWTAQALKEALPIVAKKLKVALIVFKDYPKLYRETLEVLRLAGFTRVPSMPATGLRLDFADFEEYLRTRLSQAMRYDLRRKFRKTDRGVRTTLQEVTDVTPFVDELLPLYQAVFRRSKLQFEELNKTYLSDVGRRMADKARFLIWRQNGKIVAFSSLWFTTGC